MQVKSSDYVIMEANHMHVYSHHFIYIRLYQNLLS